MNKVISNIETKEILLLSISVEDLKEIIREVIREELNPKEEKELLNFRESYEYLGCSASTLNRWKAQGKIPYRKLGKRIFFLRSELISSLDKTIFHKIQELS
jgi:predicted DNA-binding transcriptional regulator AlpA